MNPYGLQLYQEFNNKQLLSVSSSETKSWHPHIQGWWKGGNNNDMMADNTEYDFYEQGKETLSPWYDKFLGSWCTCSQQDNLQLCKMVLSTLGSKRTCRRHVLIEEILDQISARFAISPRNHWYSPHSKQACLQDQLKMQ
jgi:hypothetical protein